MVDHSTSTAPQELAEAQEQAVWIRSLLPDIGIQLPGDEPVSFEEGPHPYTGEAQLAELLLSLVDGSYLIVRSPRNRWFTQTLRDGGRFLVEVAYRAESGDGGDNIVLQLGEVGGAVFTTTEAFGLMAEFIRTKSIPEIPYIVDVF